MAREKTAVDSYITGHETWGHKLRMLRDAILFNTLIACGVGVVLYFGILRIALDQNGWDVWWYHQIAAIETTTFLGDNQLLARSVEIAGQQLGRATPAELVEATDGFYNENVRAKSWLIFLLSLGGGVAGAIYVARFWHGYGVKKNQDKFLRGGRLVSPAELGELVKKSRQGAGPYTWGGVPIPQGNEVANFLATGAMKSGKSVAIDDLMDQVAVRKKQMIIYDKTGEATETRYRPGQDFILNVFDERCVGWNIFKEVRGSHEFEQLTHSLLPDPPSADPVTQYFYGGARTVLEYTMRKLYAEGRTTTADLVDVILTFSPLEMASFLEGTPAYTYIAPGASEQAGGVLSTLLGGIKTLKYVPAGDFSIREWVENGGDTRLFLTSDPTIHNLFKPIISFYADVAVRAAMTLPKSRKDRLWIFLDELGSLRHLGVLETSLSEARKFGVVHVIGLQNVSQLVTSFGEHISRTLRASLQNYLILRVADEETAKAYSEQLGEEEIDEQSEGLSYGVANNRDGSNINTRRDEKKLVMKKEIQMLDDCTGYMQLAGAYPVAKISFIPVDRDKTNTGFVMRKDLALGPAPARPAKPAPAAPSELIPAVVQVEKIEAVPDETMDEMPTSTIRNAF